MRKLDEIGNRLVFSIVVAAIIVGSALVLQANIGPTLWGVPLPGFLGFTIAGMSRPALRRVCKSAVESLDMRPARSSRTGQVDGGRYRRAGK